MSKVGVVGSGALAQAVTARLIEFGRPVVVWGPNGEGLKESVKIGAALASTAAAVSSQAQVVIMAAADGVEAEQWHLGNHGVVQGLRDGGVVVDMTTVAPALARRLAGAYQVAGGDYLDAPISGGAPAARTGNMVVMVGGSEQAYDLAMPVLEPLVRIMVRVGEAGAGATAKLCSQLMCFVNLCGVCEALTLGAKAGIDLQKLFSVVSAGAAQSWELDNMTPLILARDLTSGYPLTTSQADLSLVLDLARGLKVFLPATSTVHQLYQAVETEGQAGRCSQSLILALEKMSEVEVRG